MLPIVSFSLRSVFARTDVLTRVCCRFSSAHAPTAALIGAGKRVHACGACRHTSPPLNGCRNSFSRHTLVYIPSAPHVRGMAGHSKWQNIRHTKAAKDSARASMIDKYCRLIRVAVKDAGQGDPKLNARVAQAVDQAKRNDVPNATIENAIKSAMTSKESLEPLVLEVKGPGGCFLVVETLTDHVTRTRQNIRSVLNKTGSSLVDGSAKHFFDFKGVINVQPTEGITLEQALDVAIEAGAEDVREVDSDEGISKLFQFTAEAGDFYNVKKHLEGLKYSIQSSGLQYLPNVKQKLSDNDLSVVGKLFELLENMPEVVNIYDNIE